MVLMALANQGETRDKLLIHDNNVKLSVKWTCVQVLRPKIKVTFFEWNGSISIIKSHKLLIPFSISFSCFFNPRRNSIFASCFMMWNDEKSVWDFSSLPLNFEDIEGKNEEDALLKYLHWKHKLSHNTWTLEVCSLRLAIFQN